MSKTWSPCTVTVSNGTASCNPDTVNVSKASNKGIKWVMASTGYVFTGVDIPNKPSDFGNADITTNRAGQSVMKVTDSVDHLGDYSYTIQFADAQGNAYSHDPKIHNKR